MTPEQEEVAGLVRSGQYFEEARAWYQTLYIGPIGERAFFMVIAGLGIFISLVAALALLGFLPITDRPIIPVANQRIEQTKPTVLAMRQPGMSMDEAMLRFFVTSYVSARESYTSPTYNRNTAFIAAHSDAPTAQAYQALYARANPRSPAAILGENGKRRVYIESTSLNQSTEPKLATVRFSTELSGVASKGRTQWTATLGYYYSPMQTTDGKDPKTGELTVNVVDPQFQVVNYAVTQSP